MDWGNMGGFCLIKLTQYPPKIGINGEYGKLNPYICKVKTQYYGKTNYYKNW